MIEELMRLFEALVALLTMIIGLGWLDNVATN